MRLFTSPNVAVGRSSAIDKWHTKVGNLDRNDEFVAK